MSQDRNEKTSDFIKQRIESNKDILKEMPPTFSSQPLPDDDDKDLPEMLQQELDDAIQKIVVQMFAFARTLACALNGRRDQNELQNYIIEESIKELEFLLKKK